MKFLFAPAEHREAGHKWYELQLPGLPIIATRVGHHKKDVGTKLEGKIARQCRVRGPYFAEMMDCTKSKDDYYEQVRRDPYPPWNIRF